MHDHLKTVMDGLATVTAFAALAKLLPALAALASLIWTCIRIYDRFFGKGRPVSGEAE